MTLADLNNLPSSERAEALQRCCGARAWVRAMNECFPLDREDQLMEQASRIWYGLEEADWREAFDHHPKIGALKIDDSKLASTSAWAASEQQSVKDSSSATLDALAEGNQRYLDKFGYLFIICATGKSAEEMLHQLQLRLQNTPEQEIKNAMAEQDQITRHRLKKLFTQ